MCGTHYYSFHRQDIHQELKRTATTEEVYGPAALLHLNRRAVSVHVENGLIKFENDLEVTADLIIAADGINVRSLLILHLGWKLTSIQSITRKEMGIKPNITPSSFCCYRCIITKGNLHELGLTEYVDRASIKF